jgi:hypothetical protein
MLICDRFVYIHMPKTGGTFVRHALTRLLAKCGIAFVDDRDNKHAGVECIPDSYRHLPVLATIRSPFDHLVSLYEFGWWKNHAEDTFDENAICQQFSYYPDISFEDYVRSTYDWSLLSRSYVNEEVRVKFQKAAIGPMTLDYIRYFANSPTRLLSGIASLSTSELEESFTGTTFLTTERLNDDLCDALASLGFDRHELDIVRALGKIVPAGSRRDSAGGWVHYYSPELKQLVRDRERMLFRVFPDFNA